MNTIKNNEIVVPTISSFVSSMRKILKLNIPQKNQVEEARSFEGKINKFDPEPDSDLNGSIDLIIDALNGFSSYHPDFFKSTTEKEKESLSCYNKLLIAQYQIIEEIIATMQNHFVYNELDSNLVFRGYIEHIIVPSIVIFQNIETPLPSFMPINHLSNIATTLFNQKDRKVINILKSYLKNKIKILVKKEKIYEQQSIKDAISVLNVQIDEIDDSYITSPNKILEYCLHLLKEIEKYSKNCNPSIIHDFYGAFLCCTILLRLNKQLNNDENFQYFIKQLMFSIFTFFVRVDDNIIDDYALKIENEEFENIGFIFELDASEFKNIGDTLLLHDKLLMNFFCKNEQLIDDNEITIKKILNKLYIFNSPHSEAFTSLLDMGIESEEIKNNYFLLEILNELELNTDLKYGKGICYFIKLILLIKKININNPSKDINEGIQYCKSIIEECKKWHFGKIKSDSILIYIILLKLTNGNYNQINTLISLYYEHQPIQHTAVITMEKPELFLNKEDNNKIYKEKLITIYKSSLELKIRNILKNLNKNLLINLNEKYPEKNI